MPPTLAFVVGSPRSGTTWLQMLLLQHPRIVSVQETHVFTEWIDPLVSRTRAQRDAGRNVGLSALLDDEQTLELARSMYDHVVRRAVDGHPDATVFVEKTPGHVHRVGTILELHPDARFVNVVRDPRAVVASTLAASRSWGRSWAPSDPGAAARMWLHAVHAGAAIGEQTPRVVTVRYEDLTTDGPATLRSVMELLGIDTDLDECAHLFELCAAESLGEGKVTAPLGMSGPVAETARRAVADGWREELSTEAVRTVEWICGSEMERLGYEIEQPHGRLPPLPLIRGAGRSLVRRGARSGADALDSLARRLR